MAVTKTLVGKRVQLRYAEVSDAAFTLKIRNDKELTKYIPQVNNTESEQYSWIARQQTKEGDYFFIIENNNKQARGTISFYNIDYNSCSCELGRFISYGNALENIEAAVLLVDFIFDQEQLQRIVLSCDERNKNIISFWKKFGATFNGSEARGTWTAALYCLTPEGYLERRAKIISLIEA